MSPTPSPSAFWWRHARVPLAAFVVIAAIFLITPLDERIARALFHDGSRWLGAGSW